MKKKAPKGVIIYLGKSRIDGKEVVAILTFESGNMKTGNMTQVWFMRSDVDPVTAEKEGLDESVCGNCLHRRHKGKKGSCYVNLGQAPLQVYKSYKRGLYPVFDPEIHGELLRWRKTRFGAYGDPACVPFECLEPIAKLSMSTTGYTHQVEHKNFDPRIATLCMVSADSPKQAKKYHDMNYRTFRVANPNDNLYPNEIPCAFESGGVQCIDCGLCNTGKKESRVSEAPSIVVTIHGTNAKKFKTASLIPTLQVA